MTYDAFDCGYRRAQVTMTATYRRAIQFYILKPWRLRQHHDRSCAYPLLKRHEAQIASKQRLHILQHLSQLQHRRPHHVCVEAPGVVGWMAMQGRSANRMVQRWGGNGGDRGRLSPWYKVISIEHYIEQEKGSVGDHFTSLHFSSISLENLHTLCMPLSTRSHPS